MTPIICEAVLIYLALGLAVTLCAGVPLDLVDAVTKVCLARRGRLPGPLWESVAAWLAVLMWPKVFWGLAR